MIRKPKILLCLLFALGLFLAPVPLQASDGQNIAYAARGAGKILSSMFAIPSAMLQDSRRVLFPFGLVTGAVRGTVQTVTGVVSGTVDVARGAAPYAKYAALAL
jgi:hypothetical protein